ncbi:MULTISPECIES: hypothetical protein [Yersiniaceae]|uniref:ABC transporter n=2 Tax=Yersiniaceae TaxID=1903411 RepID=A0A2N5EMI7_9GAMM|nr:MULTISPECIES: hypothetical protein [Yersiniaceae]MBS0968639.1 ABC transporter [Nissabacter archeti]MDV5139740.1 ABC transporter [Chimaeribacter arupi]PLR49282.1 ABC transporter [Chimaeribacter arupi]
MPAYLITAYFFAGGLLSSVFRGWRWFTGLRFRLARVLLRHVHYRWLFRLAHLARALGLTEKAQRYRSLVAQENCRCLLGDAQPLDFTWVAQRRVILEIAATWAQNPAFMREIEACAARLNQVLQPLLDAKTPIILAPMHNVSDIVAVIVGAKAIGLPLTVIVSSNADVYHPQERQQAGLENISYCSIHAPAEGRASQLMNDLPACASGARAMLLFPDMVQEYTQTAASGEMGAYPCRLFGRPASLHNGIVRLSRAISAQVVFYSLSFDNGLAISIDAPVPARQLPQRMPEIIEDALRRYPGEWLLWHLHSLFFTNRAP